MRCANACSLLLAAGVLAGCNRTPLYSDLSETQANEVQAALLSAHIDTQKTPVAKSKGWSVSVAHEEIPRAVAVLKASGLPRPPMHSLGDVFPKEGFVSSPLEERARYVFALSQEVEQTLMQLDGVVDARVHIAMPERNVLDDKQPSASASVVVIELPGAALESRETDIKAIVTDGIEGLRDVNRVTVKFFTRSAAQNPVAATPTMSTAGGYWGAPWTAAAGLLCFAIVGGAGFKYLREHGPAKPKPPGG
ncbi:MAG TPA: type III secretion inner membrane ring lipoprotein SctJ [Steroidobacteraceae bacterium]|jgi:type III secretion protein J